MLYIHYYMSIVHVSCTRAVRPSQKKKQALLFQNVYNCVTYNLMLILNSSLILLLMVVLLFFFPLTKLVRR